MNTSQGLVLTLADRNCTPVAQCSGMPTRVPPHGTCRPAPQGAAGDGNGRRAEEQLRHGLVTGCDFRKLRPQYFHTGTITPEGVHLEVWDGDRMVSEIDTRKPRGDGEPAAPRGGRIVI